MSNNHNKKSIITKIANMDKRGYIKAICGNNIGYANPTYIGGFKQASLMSKGVRPDY